MSRNLPSITLNTALGPSNASSAEARLFSPTSGRPLPPLRPLNLGPMSTHHHPSRSATRLELMPHAPSSEFASYRDFGSAPLESRSPVVSPISSPRGRVSIIDEKERASNGSQRAGKEEHSRLVVAGTVIFYLVAALIMVFANKWVLTSIPAPLFFLFVQFIIAVSLFHIAAFLGFFSIPAFDVAVARGLAPLVSVNVVGLIFNTYCLQYVDASFYQIARGLILPLTSLLSSLILRTTPTALSLIGVVIVCLGFGLGVSSEVLSTSGVGLAFGVFSSFTTSIHAIVVKTSLGKVGNSASEMAYYNNLLSAVLLLPTMLLAGEGPIVLSILGLSPSSSEYDFEISSSTLHTFVTGSLITGIFGFLICLAGFLSIQVTSPTTHMISSAVRGVLQTFLGAILFGEVVTSGRGMGIGFILAGSAVYTYAQDRARKRTQQSKSLSPLPMSREHSKEEESTPMMRSERKKTENEWRMENEKENHARTTSVSVGTGRGHGRGVSVQQVVVC